MLFVPRVTRVHACPAGGGQHCAGQGSEKLQQTLEGHFPCPPRLKFMPILRPRVDAVSEDAIETSRLLEASNREARFVRRGWAVRGGFSHSSWAP